ncbi:hypothetical protein BX666DRAFT_2021935 [Dichotomocladium elegans]|nr:hypothetical protein BX666DRAFT_2021935 [Dichotomocladium elegans]
MSSSHSPHLRHYPPQQPRSGSPLPPRTQPRQTNPLTDLIYSERTYLGELKLIDTQIAPLWMKQTRSAAPDFSEQLIHINYVYRANKHFYSRLVEVASDPGALRELGDVLMQWVDDMEQPYSEYLRHYIFDINDRHDILDTASIRLRLNTLSLNLSRKITLQSLFDAPLQRLEYYKCLYNRLFQSTKPGRPDHALLLRANNRIDKLILLTKLDHGHPTSESHDHKAAYGIHDRHEYNDNECADHQSNTKAGAGRKAFRETVIDFYKQSGVDGPIIDEDGQDLANIAPRSVKILKEVPSLNASSVSMIDTTQVEKQESTSKEKEKREETPANDKADLSSASVQMTYIQPPVHKMTLTRERHNDSDTDDDDKPLVPFSSSLARKVEGGQAQQQQQEETSPKREPSAEIQHSTQPQVVPLLAKPDNLPLATQESQQEEEKPVADPRKMASLRSVLAASVDSMAESSHSSSSFSSSSSGILHRSSTSTAQTEHDASDSVCAQEQHKTGPAHSEQRRPSATPSNASALAGLGSPPASPGEFANATKQVLYTHTRCFAFHWKDNTWYAAESPCSILVRLTNANRFCISLELISSGVLYLNAWITPDIGAQLQAESDMSLSVHVGAQRENYLIHFERRPDAVELENVMQYAIRETARMLEPERLQHQHQHQLPPPTELVDSEPSVEDVPQSLTRVMDAKCKLLAQQDASLWNNLGTVTLVVSAQRPSEKTHIAVQNSKKHTLISAIVLSRNVKRNGTKQLTLLLTSHQSSVIYMLTFKDEKTTDRVFHYLKVQNAENGW